MPGESQPATVGTLIAAMIETEARRLTAIHSGRGDDEALASLAAGVDESAWPGIGRLAEVVRDNAGVDLDWNIAANWLGPRLQRLGLDSASIGLAEAADAIEDSSDLECPGCRKRLDDADAGRLCRRCRDEARDAYGLTMGPLIVKAAVVKATCPNIAGELADAVGPEIRYLARRLFGQAKFTLETWLLLSDWAASEHGLEGRSFAEMTRASFVELLRAEVEPEVVAVAEVETPGHGLYPVVATRAALNRAMNVAPTNSRHLENCQAKGVLTFARQGPGRKALFVVSMANPDLHRQLAADIAALQEA